MSDRFSGSSFPFLCSGGDIVYYKTKLMSNVFTTSFVNSICIPIPNVFFLRIQVWVSQPRYVSQNFLYVHAYKASRNVFEAKIWIDRVCVGTVNSSVLDYSVNLAFFFSRQREFRVSVLEGKSGSKAFSNKLVCR